MKTPIWATVADTAGCYDVFTLQELFGMLPEYGQQQLRDACTLLVRHGTLKRVARGQYAWVMQ